jgi:hypothetical protein
VLLPHFGKDGTPETAVPRISQEMLADPIGTVCLRVTFFMNRFRTLGFIYQRRAASPQLAAQRGPARLSCRNPLISKLCHFEQISALARL